MDIGAGRISEPRMQEAISNRSSSERFPKEISMVPISVLGGLFVVAYCVSIVKTKRATKSDVQTLFNKK